MWETDGTEKFEVLFCVKEQKEPRTKQCRYIEIQNIKLATKQEQC